MTTENRPPLEPGALVRGLLGELRTLLRQPPGEPVKDGEGTAQLRQLGATLDEERAAGTEQLAVRYRGRTDAMQQVVDLRLRRLEAYAQRLRQAVPPEPGTYILAGRITDRSSGVAIPNLSVRLRGDVAGAQAATHSDALGYFRLDVHAIDGANTSRAGVQVEVLDDEGKVLTTSDRQFRPESGRSDFVKLEVAGERVPRNLALGRTIEDSITERMQRIERTGRIIKRGPAPGSPKGRTPSPAGPRPPGGGEKPGTRIADQFRAALDASRPAPDGSSEPAEKASARQRSSAPPGRRVIDVRGIGPTYATRLEEEGVTELGEVAAISPERLARLLEIGERQAAVMIDDAQRLMNTEPA